MDAMSEMVSSPASVETSSPPQGLMSLWASQSTALSSAALRSPRADRHCVERAPDPFSAEQPAMAAQCSSPTAAGTDFIREAASEGLSSLGTHLTEKAVSVTTLSANNVRHARNKCRDELLPFPTAKTKAKLSERIKCRLPKDCVDLSL